MLSILFPLNDSNGLTFHYAIWVFTELFLGTNFGGLQRSYFSYSYPLIIGLNQLFFFTKHFTEERKECMPFHTFYLYVELLANLSVNTFWMNEASSPWAVNTSSMPQLHCLLLSYSEKPRMEGLNLRGSIFEVVKL